MLDPFKHIVCDVLGAVQKMAATLSKKNGCNSYVYSLQELAIQEHFATYEAQAS